MGASTGAKVKKKADRLLIVDDEKWICESLRLLFARKGISVASAQNGQEALRLIEDERPDLIILDFNLPDMDGLEVLAGARKIDAALPVIFMTGHGSETVSIKAFRLGISDYFIKPFDPKTFVERALDIIGQKKKPPSSAYAGLSLPLVDLNAEIEDSKGIGKAVKHLKDHYKNRLSLEEVAEIAGISRYHFTRLFKKVMGVSFTYYLSCLRIKKAEESLGRPDTNISEVAFSAGFNSLRQFERAFKNIMGQTAAEYRRERFPDLPY